MARRMRIDARNAPAVAVKKHLSKKQQKKLARSRERRFEVELDVDSKRAPQIARELNATIVRS